MTRSPSPSLLVQSWCWISRCLWLSGLSLSWSGAAIAQLIPDRTLPQPTQVNTTVSPTGNTDQITGGTQTGSNLFHSFSEFSIPTNHAAIFNNAADVQNIITRVTGRSPSQIDGLIRANGNANLFLLNPNGIQLGRNARLGIGGSFIGSTAEQIEFSDGFRFSAMNPESSSLLTVSVPVGLQFGDRPSSILVQGSGNGFRINPETFTINDNQHDSGFQVRSGQTLALIGGDLRFIGGNLTASGGRVELGSVQGAGTVRLTPIATGWTLDYSGIDQFGRIQLSQAASVDTRGDRGGDIQVQARRLVLTEGST
ncbi:MAG: filamentous hemagglutinin N-terminal domain-containing protein, partial [Oculatellaceae cyanobacterium Prado106]|nr:filamentous hemagglutinin N-terminal domain-containing protein [Oculatellaceae cyanobacterium Prado106]